MWTAMSRLKSLRLLSPGGETRALYGSRDDRRYK